MNTDRTSLLRAGQETLAVTFFRLAASGVVPARWFLPDLPPPEARAARSGRLHIEIVSHCWRYAPFLARQLGSLILHPPRRTTVTVTVFHATADSETVAMLETFGRMRIPGLRWNWWCLPEPQLFRRAIGRNLAARATAADWVWFTDCDVLFRGDCLDRLADALQGRRDALVHPREERVTPLLAADHPLLTLPPGEPWRQDIDPRSFFPRPLHKATGPMQITHGDVARACGYCARLGIYQRPARRWRKAHEDRAFRWLLRTRGVPVDVPGVYRIRHRAKGRYTPESPYSRLRGLLRRIQSRLRDRRRFL